MISAERAKEPTDRGRVRYNGLEGEKGGTNLQKHRLAMAAHLRHSGKFKGSESL
jgi:hypothetical protein